MRKYMRYLAPVGILALAMGLLYLSAVAWGSLALEKVMFYLESPISITEGMEVMEYLQEQAEKGGEEEAPPVLCIWGQKEGVTLENKDLSRAAEANAILLCGSPGLVLEGCQVPVQGDEEGCVLSEEAAWALFGSSQVAGKEVSYREASYTIRQVLPIRGNIIAFQAGKRQGSRTGSQAQPDGEAEETLNRVTAKKQEGISSRSLSAKLAMQCGLSVRMLDLELLRGIGGGFMLLAPVTACGVFFVILLRQCKGQKSLAGKAAMAGASLLLAGIFFLFLKGQVRIPEDYIPSRWSDFSFWTGLWQEKLEAVKFLVGMEKAELDYEWVDGFRKAAGCGLFAEFLSVVGMVAMNAFRAEDSNYF